MRQEWWVQLERRALDLEFGREKLEKLLDEPTNRLHRPAERPFYRPKTTFSRVKRRAVTHTHSRPSTSEERPVAA